MQDATTPSLAPCTARHDSSFADKALGTTFLELTMEALTSSPDHETFIGLFDFKRLGGCFMEKSDCYLVK